MIAVLPAGETQIYYLALLLWLFLVWCLVAFADALHVGLTDVRDPLPGGQRRGVSVCPVIPLVPLVLWAIAFLIDVAFWPWGTTGIACIHLLIAVVVAGTIIRDLFRHQRANKLRSGMRRSETLDLDR